MIAQRRTVNKERLLENVNFWAIFGRTVTSNCSPYATGPLSCLSVTLMYYGQTAGWIKMPLDIEVGLGPGHIVLDGNPALPNEKGHSSPPLTFSVYGRSRINRGPCLL